MLNQTSKKIFNQTITNQPAPQKNILKKYVMKKNEDIKKNEQNLVKKKEISVKIPQKSVISNSMDLKKKVKKQNSQTIEPDLYERLEVCIPKPIISHDKNLLDDIENQEMIFLKNNFMPHELEYTNPQIKNYYKPQMKILQDKVLKEKNDQNYKIEQISKSNNENGWKNKK